MPIRGGDNADANTLQGLIPGLPKQVAEELAAVPARAVAFRRGETIVDRDSAVVPGVVVEGAVGLVVRSADGREATVRTGGRGSMFGLAGLFELQRDAVAVDRRIVAVEASTVILLDRGIVLRAATRHAGFALQIARNLADSVSLLTDAAGRLAFLSVRQRLAAHLLAIATEAAQRHRVAIATQQELAGSIGTVREVVARTLHELRDEGLVTVRQGRIELIDEPGLVAMARGVT